MTLEDYFRSEYAGGKIDFSLRAHVWEHGVTIYIHPTDKDGMTTPSLTVVGNAVRLASGCFSPDWPEEK